MSRHFDRLAQRISTAPALAALVPVARSPEPVIDPPVVHPMEEPATAGPPVPQASRKRRPAPDATPEPVAPPQALRPPKKPSVEVAPLRPSRQRDRESRPMMPVAAAPDPVVARPPRHPESEPAPVEQPDRERGKRPEAEPLLVSPALAALPLPPAEETTSDRPVPAMPPPAGRIETIVRELLEPAPASPSGPEPDRLPAARLEPMPPPVEAPVSATPSPSLVIERIDVELISERRPAARPARRPAGPRVSGRLPHGHAGRGFGQR